MSRTVEIICLANSDKEGNRCVAGLDVETGDWIRPVSDTDDGGLNHTHYLTKERHDPDPLDILRIPIARADSESHQPENVLITSEPWERCDVGIGDREARLLLEAIHSDSDLFGDENKKIGLSEIEQSSLDQSLTLIRPEKPQFKTRERDGKANQPRANFELYGTEYDLPITDPDWKYKIKSQEVLPDMDLESEPASAYTDKNERPLFTISLSEPYNGVCYKLVAAVIPVPTAVIDHIDDK